MKRSNDLIVVIGRVVELEFDRENSHDGKKVRLWKGKVSTIRTSNVEDVLPICITERSNMEQWLGKKVRISGEIHTTYVRKDKSTRLYITVTDIMPTKEPDSNHVIITGEVYKTPVCRTTPLTGRDVTDIMLLVPSHNGYKQHIPCIVWKEGAKKASHLKVGEEVTFRGRLQSRTYPKENEWQTTYEVSVSDF